MSVRTRVADTLSSLHEKLRRTRQANERVRTTEFQPGIPKTEETSDLSIYAKLSAFAVGTLVAAILNVSPASSTAAVRQYIATIFCFLTSLLIGTLLYAFLG